MNKEPLAASSREHCEAASCVLKQVFKVPVPFLSFFLSFKVPVLGPCMVPWCCRRRGTSHGVLVSGCTATAEPARH
jgi:hypothetical protein